MLEAALHGNFDPALQGNGLRTLEKALNECEMRLGRPATNLDICNKLGMNLREFYSLLDCSKGVVLGRVADHGSAEGDGDKAPMVRYFPDPADEDSFWTCTKAAFESAMAGALEALPKNEKLVVSLYHNEDLTMEEIAQIFGISQVRVVQIYTIAILRIRARLQSLAGI
jgi:RNA polymerase sigma factor for flagellar operon FliA